MPGPSAGDPELLAVLHEEIRASGPIPFDRFMDLALYHPGRGYYARGPSRLGRGGDYYTASDVGPAFGRVLARQIAELDEFLGSPEPFRYVEWAAGRGLLARDLLDALGASHGELASRCRATLIDRSEGMRQACAAAVPEAAVAAPGSVACGGAGCVVAVELFDALPVRRVRRSGGALLEVRVGWEDGGLLEVETPADPAVASWAEDNGAAPSPGDEAEVPLRLAPALSDLARTIDRGFLLVVDYGFEASRLYGPGHRRGTLLAYHGHSASEDTLARVREQDLTAHENLTALAREARALGLAPLGWTTQDRFLIANGILDELEGDGAEAGVEAVKRRLQVKQLLHPHGMGRTFKVAVFAKAMDPAPVPRGLKDPFAR